MNSSKCVLNINLDIIAQNYKTLQTLCPQAEVGAAVKTNCYGLGVKDISPTLIKHGCCHFFVANCEEGLFLRNIIGSSANIYILNGFFREEANILIEYNLIPVLFNLEQILLWQQCSTRLNKRLKCIININTGMYRLGMSDADFYKFVSMDIKELDILYLMSHLASSEEKDNISNQIQLNKFNAQTSLLPHIKKTFANSGGIFLGSDYQFDLVRPGAALYGINLELSNKHSKYLQNPLELHAPIIHLNELGVGESVGYNSTYTNTSNKSCRIATIPIGFADGFCRSLSNKGATYINGIKAPVIGLVSMDSTIIDVSSVPKKDLFLGQKVEIIGNNSKLSHISSNANTNEYEILTRLGTRFKRVYI
ncbi:MAG: alanine racemase [Rickettsiales bacterium]|nr:MAG: alanine racemase [Rickettsiales bacterium]